MTATGIKKRAVTLEEKNMELFDRLWHEIVEHLAVSFNLDSEMRDKLEAKNTARLIGALPFLADCDHPLKTAVQHVAVYILSIQEGTREYFYHTPDDDVSLDHRLQPIMQFSGGNPAVLSRGMNLLKLQMVAGYLRDVEKDMHNIKYNPVAVGTWNAREIMDELTAQLESYAHPEMDAIMTVGESIESFWSV